MSLLISSFTSIHLKQNFLQSHADIREIYPIDAQRAKAQEQQRLKSIAPLYEDTANRKRNDHRLPHKA